MLVAYPAFSLFRTVCHKRHSKQETPMKRTILLVLTALLPGAAFPVMAACTDPAGIEVDWYGCDIGDANLSGTNLSDANLIYARLNDANLSGANLTGAKLSNAHLNSANLSGANLSGTVHFRTDFTRANLSGSDLTGAKDLHRAKLSNANLSEAIWRDGRICSAGSIGTCD
jgi:uncharacterized protein YjbI with pentapeptide repeats